MKLLIDIGADINATDKFGRTPPMLASSYGRKNNIIHIIEAMINTKADINVVDHEGNTALLDASMYGHWEIVRHLIKFNSDITIVNNESLTALIIATTNGDKNVVKQLLKAFNIKATINAKNIHGETALMRATENYYSPYINIFNQLTEAGADTDIINNYGEIALHIASRNGSVHIVDRLIDSMTQL